MGGGGAGSGHAAKTVIGVMMMQLLPIIGGNCRKYHFCCDKHVF